ncbi:hypothetical protein SAMN05216464_10892 [Mucilaginibacter pineti]|uniref:Uncharacterized protein n=1 Tax=Mucilaginibacter pineti TaxID=1391627 RepID=A0A1G7EMT0_9SPHI|nr:hypothetical protein [Mucilaginibacter pineti]SDE64954.1 hypothetical protein SAMN05216464_10892 [Mucilaginibacter pineti]
MEKDNGTNGFDYQKFMEQEFPKNKNERPSSTTLIKHIDRISALLFDCALQAVKVAPSSAENFQIAHTNTRYIIVSNYRLRVINLIKILDGVFDINGNVFFDDATANIMVRSLLESYLVYFRLYNECSENLVQQQLYFNLYELSSILQFRKQREEVFKKAISPGPIIDFKPEVDDLIDMLEKNSEYELAPEQLRKNVQAVKAGKKDYLSYMNFTAAIKTSPLPTNFATHYYSYASAFAHSEGFSIKYAQMRFENKKEWPASNELIKFKLLADCLYITSQFLSSFIEYDHTQLEDEREREVWEVVSLAAYYTSAMNKND